jgi:ABC-type amino acid transport substrate-binding protein
MNRCLIFLLLPTAFFFAASLPCNGANSSTASPGAFPDRKILKVGVTIDEPFIMKKGEVYEGYSIDLWQSLAADLGLKFEYVPYPDFAELIKATEQGAIDVNADSLFVTSERLGKMDFVLPFFQGGLQIMVNENRRGSLQKLWKGLRDSGHLRIFGFGLGVILLGTILLTLGERRWNKEFHKDWNNGLAESFYHVMSVVMTGKSTHKGLPGPFGKILAGIWIAFGVAVVAYITSSVTSVMTVNKLHSIINGPQDLPGHKVGVMRGSVGESYCGKANLDCEHFATLPNAVKALLHHQVDAIVYYAMGLQWYDNSHPELPITEEGPDFRKEVLRLCPAAWQSPATRTEHSPAQAPRVGLH